MSPAEYKQRFDQAYQTYHASPAFDTDAYFDPDTPESDIPEIPEVPLCDDLALEMLKVKVPYWEHYGWIKACDGALYSLVFNANCDLAQELAAWLMADAPKGIAEQYPELVNYAAGEFPVEQVNRQNEMLTYIKEQKWRNEPRQEIEIPQGSPGVSPWRLDTQIVPQTSA
ncbi:hypothetical protein D0962_28875 [Leptolyngbyaceae cyanobacterium CCMR0082]|uniref:DUF4274 domain-containing protein n=1 Tax=Adonisia turfae CCMR0082 TaxID=2304604 RepID=A0A6M0SE15_9CYAN|nr:hypothetical protein [Adonisia turfae]NEZ66725.1 hypothetical protein [Adonisia turfae CCMR0082]